MDVSMDFIIDLLNLDYKSINVVVVDIISKYAHFFALPHPFCYETSSRKDRKDRSTP